MTEYDPKLVERTMELMRHAGGNDMNTCKFGPAKNRTWWAEAAAIRAELPKPVDPDLLLARELASSIMDERGEPFLARQIMRGVADGSEQVAIALAAIKKIRSQSNHSTTGE